MPRIPKPYKWKDKYFVTQAGGRTKILCLIVEGERKANRELSNYLNELDSNAGMLTECVDAFVKWKATTTSPRTAKDYKYELEYLKEKFGKLDVSELNFFQANEFLQGLRERELGNVSINHHLRSAKAFLNYAVKCGWIRENPWSGVDEFPERGRRRIVTEEEFEKLLAACDKSRKRGAASREESVEIMKDILRVLRLTAMRPGELRILEWHHIDFHEGVIIIPPDKHKNGSRTRVPKDRVIPFMDDVKQIFESRRKKHGHHGHVFVNLDGNQWGDKVLSRKFNRLRQVAGLDEGDSTGEQLCLYSLRHTRLTEAATKEGWNLHALAAYAGHSPTMTERYVHVMKETMAQALREGHKRRTQSSV